METPALVASREAEFFQTIERLDRALLSGHLIAAPDDVAELLLARGFVEEAEFLRPDLVEDDATRGGFDDAACPRRRRWSPCRNPDSASECDRAF